MISNCLKQSNWTLLLLAGLGGLVDADHPQFRELPPNNLHRSFRTQPATVGGSSTTLAFVANEHGLFTVDAEGKIQCREHSQEAARQLARLKREPACAAFSPQAEWVAHAGSDGIAYLWRSSTGRQIRLPHPPDERTVAMRFSNDGSRLAYVTNAGTLRLWSMREGKVERRLPGRAGAVQHLAFSPTDARIAATSFSKGIAIHAVRNTDSESHSAFPLQLEVGARVTALALLNDDELVVATSDGLIRLIAIDTARTPRTIAQYSCAAWSLAFDSASTRMVAGSWDGCVRIWETEQWQPLQSMKQHTESITGVMIHEQYGLLTASLDGQLLSYSEMHSVQPSAVIAGRSDSVWVTAHSPDNKRLFVGGREHRFELWDIESKSLVVTRKGHPTTRCAAYSPDGKFLVTGGDDGKIFVNDPATGATLHILSGHPGALSALEFVNRGTQLISGCDGGVLTLWDFPNQRPINSWREHRHQIYCLAVSPDEKWLITGGGDWTTGDPGELIAWNLPERSPRARLPGHELAVWSIVFTPDGKQFATSDSKGAVRIWNTESLMQERTLQHSTWVRPLAMSPDGSTLAVGRGDGSVRLWDTATWQQIGVCQGHRSFSFHLRFDTAHQRLTSSGDDGTVQMWSTDQFRKGG